MKVTIIERPKRRIDRIRCQSRTGSHGSFPFEKSNGQCARVATFKVGKKKLCRQHAGDACLVAALQQEQSDG